MFSLLILTLGAFQWDVLSKLIILIITY